MKYKVGDRVKIKSLDWYNENKDETDDVECSNNIWFYREMSKFCGKVMTISHVRADHYTMAEDLVGYWTDEMIEGLVEPIDCKKCGLTRMSIRCLFMDNCPHNQPKNIIEIPKDYVLKDENGNVINATKIVLEKKKKEYPKTYEECCLINGCENRIPLKIIGEFTRLINARNAYWKLYREEMGLGKPWEPDYDSGINKYGIICISGVIQKSNPTTNWERHLNKILDFPTVEMRDAFYENFKELIEQCKELV